MPGGFPKPQAEHSKEVDMLRVVYHNGFGWAKKLSFTMWCSVGLKTSEVRAKLTQQNQAR
jgi:hypothetical protein